MRRYRIVHTIDGLGQHDYKPQYKGLLFWKNFWGGYDEIGIMSYPTKKDAEQVIKDDIESLNRCLKKIKTGSKEIIEYTLK